MAETLERLYDRYQDYEKDQRRLAKEGWVVASVRRTNRAEDQAVPPPSQAPGLGVSGDSLLLVLLTLPVIAVRLVVGLVRGRKKLEWVEATYRRG